MRDFLNVHSWFEQKYKEQSDSRYITLKTALNIFLQRMGHTIVETGTTKWPDDWGSGMATLLFAEVVSKYGGKVYTVDNYPLHIENCRQITEPFADKIEYVLSDSLEFLKNFEKWEKGKIDLLYLDTMDYPLTLEEGPVEICQQHQLEELKLAYPHLSRQAVVLLDDNDFPDGGKTKLAKGFLRKKKWTLVLDTQQSLWIRK